MLQILVKIWAVSLWVWIYYTFIFLLTTATKCVIPCHHEFAVKMKSWSSREYSNIETNEFLLLCKTEFNFQANDCYNITAYFRSWNRCAAMRNKWTLWLVVVVKTTVIVNGVLHCTAQQSRALNEGNAWCWTRSFEAKIWHARSHAWIVAGNCTAGLCITITKDWSSPSNVKATPTGLERLWGLQEVENPRFQDSNRHRKATVRFPALRTGPLFAPGNNPSTHFCSRLSRPQGHSTAGRFMLIKNSSDTIGIRTRDLPDCRAESPHEGHQNYYRRKCSGHPTRQEWSANT
jgi:hypothetical protein